MTGRVLLLLLIHLLLDLLLLLTAIARSSFRGLLVCRENLLLEGSPEALLVIRVGIAQISDAVITSMTECTSQYISQLSLVKIRRDSPCRPVAANCNHTFSDPSRMQWVISTRSKCEQCLLWLLTSVYTTPCYWNIGGPSLLRRCPRQAGLFAGHQLGYRKPSAFKASTAALAIRFDPVWQKLRLGK